MQKCVQQRLVPGNKAAQPVAAAKAEHSNFMLVSVRVRAVVAEYITILHTLSLTA